MVNGARKIRNEKQGWNTSTGKDLLVVLRVEWKDDDDQQMWEQVKRAIEGGEKSLQKCGGKMWLKGMRLRKKDTWKFIKKEERERERLKGGILGNKGSK